MSTMAEPTSQQQQYPNLNPYASSNGSSAQDAGAQVEQTKNTAMSSKVGAHMIRSLDSCMPKGAACLLA